MSHEPLKSKGAETPKSASGGEARFDATARRSSTDDPVPEKDARILALQEVASIKNNQNLGDPQRCREDDGPTIQGTSAMQGNGHEMNLQLTEKEREDLELEKSIDEYAALAMNEKMIEEDDLLDEFDEPEKNIEDGMFDEEQIEAISQLSPEPRFSKARPPIAKIQQKSVAEGEKRDVHKDAGKEQKAKKGAAQTATVGKKRGARSPDIKGVTASRKLATHGRLSPKPKQMKPDRDLLKSSNKVPRHEVYPSASKSRKPVSTSGSMVSQKPSSTQI